MAEKDKLVPLSASRIGKLDKCSWQYHCSYKLKLPDESNDGAKRGSVTHLVLECLARARGKRRDYVESIRSQKTMSAVPSVYRMAFSYASKLGVADKENFDMIESFVQVGLNFDFFCEDESEFGKGELQPPEKWFDIVKDEPLYRILGFIDKICLYPEKKLVRIIDYKTSKSKFSGEEKDYNVQSLVYSIAALNLFPDYDNVVCDFLFLKFKKAPLMRYEYSKESLRGFEEYLEYVDDYLEDFDLKKAKSNFAKDTKKNFWLCGKFKGDLNKAGLPAYICQYKYPFSYWSVEKDGRVLFSSQNKEDAEKFSKGRYTVSEKYYGGCPKFRHKCK